MLRLFDRFRKRPQQDAWSASAYLYEGTLIVHANKRLRIPSVFLTCEGGSIVFQTFWYVDGRWHYHHDTRAHDALEQDYDSLIPFDEEFAVPTAYEVEDE